MGATERSATTAGEEGVRWVLVLVLAAWAATEGVRASQAVEAGPWKIMSVDAIKALESTGSMPTYIIRGSFSLNETYPTLAACLAAPDWEFLNAYPEFFSMKCVDQSILPSPLDHNGEIVE